MEIDRINVWAGLSAGVCASRQAGIHTITVAVKPAIVMELVEDLTKLSDINGDIILHQLKGRFEQDRIYVSG